jgi:hypothetical protein
VQAVLAQLVVPEVVEEVTVTAPVAVEVPVAIAAAIREEAVAVEAVAVEAATAEAVTKEAVGHTVLIACERNFKSSTWPSSLGDEITYTYYCSHRHE